MPLPGTFFGRPGPLWWGGDGGAFGDSTGTLAVEGVDGWDIGGSS